MKKHYLLLMLAVFSLAGLYAQPPNAIAYQGVARNQAGIIIPNQPIKLRMTVHDATASGTIVFCETHALTTTALGQFSLNIGQGTPSIATLSAVNWGSGAKFLQVELDPAGGNNFIDMGTTQFMSTPYALYAKSSGSSGALKKAKLTYEYPFGSLATSGDWFPAPLNTIRYDDIGITLSDNKVTLPAGTYEVSAYSTTGNARGGLSWTARLRIINVGTNEVLAKSVLVSLLYNSIVNGSAFPVAMNDERFSLQATTTIELQNFFYSGRYGITSSDGPGDTLTELMITKLN